MLVGKTSAGNFWKPPMQPIFTDWKPHHSDLFGRHTVELGHSLATSELFSDDALAELIEQTPREDYHVSTMDPQTLDPGSRREGVIDGINGRQVIEAIRNGHIWLNLRNPQSHVPAYSALLKGLYGEIEERQGAKTFKQRMTILISSPNVRVGYHCDVPGQSLWQLRGVKRVYVYPNEAPFLPPADLERILLGEAHEVSLKYERWFDEHAQVIDLQPGRIVTWPHNAPHRIDNHDCLNVSLTTEHWTAPLRNAYAANYANGILRSRLGLRSLSQSTSSAAFYPKLAIAAAYKVAGLQKQHRKSQKIDFRVDPASPHGFVDIPAYELGR